MSWEYVNHDTLVRVLQCTRPVDDTLRLSGKAIVEDFDYCRILVGRISVNEIAAWLERHGDRLVERNIRRFLGLQGNRVNQAMSETLLSPKEQGNFYFYTFVNCLATPMTSFAVSLTQPTAKTPSTYVTFAPTTSARSRSSWP